LYYCGRRRRWLYALLLTSGVTFLGVLPFVAERPTVYFAASYLVPPPGAAKDLESAIEAQLASSWRDALPGVVERVAGAAWSDDDLEVLSKSLSIAKGDGKGGPDVAISLEWQDGKTAEQIVRTLAEELCERKNREIQTPAALVTDDDASEARLCAEVLRDEARRELAEFKQVIAEEEKQAPPPVEAPPSQPVKAAELVVNPAWAALHKELADVDAQKVKLMEVYTEQHPRVAHLDAQREELAARLAQTPQQIESGESTTPRDQFRSPVQSGPSPEAMAKRQKQLARLSELERAVADADRRVAEAAQAERPVAVKPLATGRRWSVNGYTPATVRSGSRATAPLGWLGMISLLAGSVVAIGVVGIRPTFESAAEARALLGVPVVGVIPADEPASRPVSVRRWAAGLVGVAEWVVVGLVVVLAAANFRQPGFSKKLLADPITVLASPAEWIAGAKG
jgi:hypothetical protein